MDNILEVKDLTKRYHKSDFCMDGVTFSLPYGAIMGVVGENGAGKTTVIGCILNTIMKDGGTVKLFGREMKDGDTALREEIGVVFDAGNFPENLTPMKLSKVMQGIYSKWEEQLFQSYLVKFGLPGEKRIKAFSRGMTMKLSIAAALSHNSKLLILDEATSGLDPIVREEILDVFLDFIQDEQHSILLSSHITSDLEKIADYITFLHQGKVLLTADKDTLIYQYGVIRCGPEQFQRIDRPDILAYKKRDYHIDVLVADKKEAERKYRGFVVDQVSVEEIMLLLVKGEHV